MSVSIVIPAAGSSSRMRGKDKLLQLVHGVPLLRLVAERAQRVSSDVIVALPKESDRRRALDGLAVTIVSVDSPSDGMSASLMAGVTCVSRHATGIMILPADMPDISEDDLSNIVQHFDKSREITRGVSETGVAGHPVVFPISLKDELMKLHGDTGARDLIANRKVVLVELPSDHALVDLDTPEDWARWQDRQTDK